MCLKQHHSSSCSVSDQDCTVSVFYDPLLYSLFSVAVSSRCPGPPSSAVEEGAKIHHSTDCCFSSSMIIIAGAIPRSSAMIQFETLCGLTFSTLAIARIPKPRRCSSSVLARTAQGIFRLGKGVYFFLHFLHR